MDKENENVWDPIIYSEFLALRTRPAIDLLSAIPHTFLPQTVYDLGCGTGNSTILLRHRWPNAKIVGIDSSSKMLEKANSTHHNIVFLKKDIGDFQPENKIDCIFANASLHWLDDHENLIPKLFRFLTSEGILAIQMPNNFHSPTHQVIVQVLQQDKSWQPLLKKLRYGFINRPFYNLVWYYDLLTQIGTDKIQLWETDYFQEMEDYQEIYEWVKGTVLRTVLHQMDSTEEIRFSKLYKEGIAKKYPIQTNGKILLSFRRLFIVASNFIY